MIRSKINRLIGGTLFLSTILIGACQEEVKNDPLPDPPYEGASEVTLNFTVEGELSSHLDPTEARIEKPDTRTDLSGSDNLQHVTSVQLYIFNGTGDNATCVASEDVGWSKYFNNIPPTVTSTMKYRVKYAGLMAGTSYTFLAIGMDTSSPVTYGYPAAIQVGSTTLGNAIATLSGTESATWTNMRQSELFAGAIAVTPTLPSTQSNVNLWRRVAGVMGWFTNIPSQINGTSVSAIRITLYTKQNKSVPLIQRTQTPVFKDYISNPLTISGGDVLVQIPVPVGISSSTVLSKGSFVLPITAPPANSINDYSLKVELTDGSGNVLRFTRVTLSGTDDSNSSTGNGTGVIDPQGVYRFPIVANRFYGIGTKNSPIDLKGNVTRNAIQARLIKNWKEIVSE